MKGVFLAEIYSEVLKIKNVGSNNAAIASDIKGGK